MKRILICGGRNFGKVPTIPFQKILYEEENKEVYDRLYEYLFAMNFLDKQFENTKDIIVISGMASGADTIGLKWAEQNNYPVEKYYPDWQKYGKKAGLLRNEQMLKEGKPDLIVAFPGSNGTKHMVKIGKKTGVKILEVQYGPFDTFERETF